MDEDWNIECSDEEYKNITGPWEPSAEKIEKLYRQLESNEIPQLSFKCKYRAPSPEVQEAPTSDIDVKKVEDKSDFDFMDEVTAPKLKIRNKGEETLKGSAKKKTTSLDGVINNMRRHNLIPQTPVQPPGP